MTFTEEGTLLLSTQLTRDNPHYQSNYDTLAVREYELDYDAMVLRQIWAFGEDQGIAGKYNGEAHRLANGNTLHNYGSAGHLREVTSDKEIVWEVSWSGNKLLGRTIFLEDLWAFAP